MPVCVCVCLRAYACVCVCVCARESFFLCVCVSRVQASTTVQPQTSAAELRQHAYAQHVHQLEPKKNAYAQHIHTRYYYTYAEHTRTTTRMLSTRMLSKYKSYTYALLLHYTQIEPPLVLHICVLILLNFFLYVSSNHYIHICLIVPYTYTQMKRPDIPSQQLPLQKKNANK